MSNLHNVLAALERQQMLDREKAVVRSLHDRDLCMEGCIFCKEESEMEKSADEPATNIGPQGCVAKQPSIFDEIAKIPIEIMDPTLHRTLHQRGSDYGDYGYMATCAQRIKEAMGPRAHMSAVQRESLDMIATKIARLCCGDPNNRDSWHDIQGYAKLAEDRLPVQGAGSNAATS